VPFDVPQRAEPFPEGFEEPRGSASVQEHANAVSLPRLLCLRHDRRQEQGQKEDERLSCHCRLRAPKLPAINMCVVISDRLTFPAAERWR
jgi:hypothetical protein